jgi:hypoxanthine phosphoribosyltransferase
MSETVEKSYFHTLQMRNALLQIEDQMVHANWMPDLILGINRGGCVPGVYLSHRLSREHMVLDIRLRDHRAEPDISVLTKQYELGKKILVIDDINDTGATFKYIEEKFGRPERLRFAALVDNTPSGIRVDLQRLHHRQIQRSCLDCFPMGRLGKITTKNCIDFSNKNLLK